MHSRPNDTFKKKVVRQRYKPCIMTKKNPRNTALWGCGGEVLSDVSFKLSLRSSRGFGCRRMEAGNSGRRNECSQRSRGRKK